MRLYDKEVNRCNYKTFNTDDLEKFKSMLKSNIRNFNELVEPTIETMINEDKAEELLAYIEREIKARDRNTAIKKFSKELRHNPYCRQSYRSTWFSCKKININKPKMLIQYGGDTWQFDEVKYEQE